MSAKQPSNPPRNSAANGDCRPAPCSPGEAIQAQLDKIGVKQNALAERIGIDKKTINQICKNRVRLTAPVAAKIAEAIWMDARELLVMQVDCDLRENSQDQDAER